jgi:hypothetical protein
MAISLALRFTTHSTGKWTLMGSMTVPRDGHDAVLLQNGQVLVAGGIDASTIGCTTLATAELYNPSTGTWTGTGSMSVGRYSFTLTLLSNGEVLAAGGTNCGNGGLLSAELYNPATGTWTATDTMTSGNQSTGAALLQNARVFVVGNDNLYNPSLGTRAATAKDPIGGGHLLCCSRMGTFLLRAPYKATAYTPPLQTSGPPSPRRRVQRAGKIARVAARCSILGRSW